MNNNLCTKIEAELVSMGATNIRTAEVKTHAGDATAILCDIKTKDGEYFNCGFVQYWEDYPQRFALWDADASFETFDRVRNAFDNYVEAEAEAAYERQFAG